jgi:hypothetical protein
MRNVDSGISFADSDGETAAKPGKENKRRSRVLSQPKGTIEHTVSLFDNAWSFI